MKKILLLVSLIIFSFSVISQNYEEIKPSRLPKPVQKYIENDFPGGTIVRAAQGTENGQTYYAAVISFRGDKRIMLFDERGNFVRKVSSMSELQSQSNQLNQSQPKPSQPVDPRNMEKIIPRDNLPLKIQNYLKQNYPQGNLLKTSQLYINSILFYRVIVQEGARDYNITFNKYGDYLSKKVTPAQAVSQADPPQATPPQSQPVNSRSQDNSSEGPIKK